MVVAGEPVGPATAGWGIGGAGGVGGCGKRARQGANGPDFQVTSRGRRPRTRWRIDGSGALVGRWTVILVFISTMRAATLISRSRSVSNWAARQDEALGISARRLHSSQ